LFNCIFFGRVKLMRAVFCSSQKDIDHMISQQSRESLDREAWDSPDFGFLGVWGATAHPAI